MYQSKDTLVTAQESFKMLIRLERFRGIGKIDSAAIEDFNSTYGKGLFEKLYAEM